ncbi:MAG: hypothetical protein A3F43_03785 [Gammaproteobacteria bacterium RIFCSPHIGHO2_12_FULL_42_10]|nr:MAG: hypothetical protein A3F43_03785 [Gammaproteobacteria bacterium RIFCSPHIGHO2_12_FULL_42_10]
MRFLKVMLVSSFLTASFSTIAQAVSLPPATCPAVNAIQHAGLLGVMEEKSYQVYAVYQISKYTTPETWGFVIAVPINQATSKADAMNKAKAALPSLNGTPEPMPTDASNRQWYCLYDNDYQYIAAAFTPLMADAMINDILKASNARLP